MTLRVDNGSHGWPLQQPRVLVNQDGLGSAQHCNPANFAEDIVHTLPMTVAGCHTVEAWGTHTRTPTSLRQRGQRQGDKTGGKTARTAKSTRTTAHRRNTPTGHRFPQI